MKRNRILNQIGVILVTCLFILLSSQITYAACTGSSPTWTTTPDYTSVAACVAGATAQDTINVSAGTGSATWTSTLEFHKELILSGQVRQTLQLPLV